MTRSDPSHRAEGSKQLCGYQLLGAERRLSGSAREADTVPSMGMGAALFFSHGHLESGPHSRWVETVNEIQAAPEEHVLRVDELAWAAALYERYSVEAPVLDRTGTWMEEPEPVQVDVSGDVSRIIRVHSAYVPGHTVKVHVPFTGDGGVFDFLPASHIMVELYAVVGEQELIKEITYPDDRPSDITAEADQFISRIETNLGSARAQISRWDSCLEAHGTAATITP